MSGSLSKGWAERQEALMAGLAVCSMDSVDFEEITLLLFDAEDADCFSQQTAVDDDPALEAE